MKYLIGLFALALLACNKEETVVPKLTDTNPLVYKISGNNGGIPFYVFYNDSLVTRIDHTKDSLNLERTDFFYTGSRLDSAITTNNFFKGLMPIEVKRFKFRYNSDGLIGSITETSNYQSKPFIYFLMYRTRKLVVFSCQGFRDSIAYDSTGRFSARYTKLYAPYNFDGRAKFSNLRVLQTSDRPDPYRLIESRLGYPFFRTNIYCSDDYAYGALSVSEYEVFGRDSIRCSWIYELDAKGRIKSQHLSNQPNWRKSFDYY